MKVDAGVAPFDATTWLRRAPSPTAKSRVVKARTANMNAVKAHRGFHSAQRLRGLGVLCKTRVRVPLLLSHSACIARANYSRKI
jgi:hypothetical protein